MRRLVWAGVLAAGWMGCAAAQQAGSTTTLEMPVPLLGPMMGNAVRAGDAVTGTDPAAADPAHAAALKEAGLERFARAKYAGTQVESLQFHDASGARAAFSMYGKDGARGGWRRKIWARRMRRAPMAETSSWRRACC